MSTVDRSATGVAFLARRILCRVLLVVGGTVAGTAIAWTIASATAAAESSCALPKVPGLSTVVCRAERVLAPAPVVDIGRDLVEPIGSTPRITIDVAVLGRSDRSGAEHHPGGGAHESPSLVPPVGESSAAAPPVPPAIAPDAAAAAVPPAGAAEHPRGPAAGVSAAAVPDRQAAPDRPGLAGTPLAPPSPGQSGSAGGANPTLFAALLTVAGPAAMTGVPAPLPRDVPAATRPGAQPGVTPD
jgi:hypothetical protein